MAQFVYILKSLSDKGFYVGMSKNIDSRLKQHNNGKVRSTKHRTPLRVVYHEEFDTINEARAREKYLKSYQGAREKMGILDKFK